MDNKFSVGDVVVHIREGISKINSVTSMGGADYFVVDVLKDQGEEIFVPVAKADSVIRFIMDGKTADGLLRYLKTVVADFNPNTKQRRDAYKRRLNSGDVKDIAYLARQLYFYNKSLTSDAPVRLGPLDLDMLGRAETLFLDELALSYSVPRDKVLSFVTNRIETI